MDNRILKKIKLSNNSGQGTLELAATFIVVILLVGGIIKIWLWANNQIVARQIQYNNSRVTAGTASDSYTLTWPVHHAPELRENDVILK